MSKKIAFFVLSIIVAILAGCAGTNPDVMLHRNMAEDAMITGDSRAAMSHIDYAVDACEDDTTCERGIFRWMLDFASNRNNDFFRAKAYERIALSSLKAYSSDENNSEELDIAKEIATVYIEWADSLRQNRGDLFPLPDALILGAEVNRFDRPDSALDFVGWVFRIGLEFEKGEIPQHLRIAIGMGKSIIDGIGAEMNSRMSDGAASIDSGENAVDDLIYAFRASAALGNAAIASNSATLLSGFYNKKGDLESASKWGSAALKWKGEEIHGEE